MYSTAPRHFVPCATCITLSLYSDNPNTICPVCQKEQKQKEKRS